MEINGQKRKGEGETDDEVVTEGAGKMSDRVVYDSGRTG